MRRSLAVSSSTRRETGTPVQEATIDAMSSSLTSGMVSPSLSRQVDSFWAYRSLSFFSFSRSEAAVS